MASMSLANIPFSIPVVTNTIRTLDADLYDAGQQGSDAENISATGNLNIGNILDYDEHMQHLLEGANTSFDQPRVGDISYSSLAKEDMITQTLPSLQDGYYNGPSDALPVGYVSESGGLKQDSLSQAPLPSTPESIDSSGGSEPSLATGDDISALAGGNTTTTTTNQSSTVNNTTNVTNITNNYDNGDCVDICTPINCSITNITNIVCDSLTQITNILNCITTPVTNIIDTVITITGSTVNNVLDITNNLLTSITNIAGDTLNTVTTILDDTVSNVTNIVQTVVNLTTDIVGDVTNTITTTVDTVLSSTTDIVSDVVDVTSDILSEVVNIANSLVTSVTDILEGSTDLLGSLLDGSCETGGCLLDPVVDVVTNVLETTTDVVEQVIAPITAVTEGVVDVASDILSDVVNVADAVLAPVTDVTENLLGNLLGGGMGYGDGLLSSIIDPVLDTTEGVVATVDDALASITGSDDTLGNITDPLTDTIASVVDAGDGLLGGGDTGNGLLDSILGGDDSAPLLDGNVTLLSEAFDSADDNASINIDADILSLVDGSPDAAGLGLLDVDASLLSTNDITDGIDDGLSLSLNTDALGTILPPLGDIEMDPIEIDIPLPGGSDAPLITELADTTSTLADAVDHSLSDVMDTTISLDVLGSVDDAIAVVDAGVLFAGITGEMGGGYCCAK